VTLEAWIALGSIAVELIIGAVVYGKLTQKVTGHAEAIEEIKDEQIRQWESIGEHGKKIAALEAIVPQHRRTT
jgi:hypothetical protein